VGVAGAHEDEEGGGAAVRVAVAAVEGAQQAAPRRPHMPHVRPGWDHGRARRWGTIPGPNGPNICRWGEK